MEVLAPADRYDINLLREMEAVLDEHVWCRRLPDSYVIEAWGVNWYVALMNRVGQIPHPPDHGPNGLAHGDCTVGNAMRRGDRLIIIDPLPPQRHVVNSREADMGRILQSAFGWEMLMYGEEYVPWAPPCFWFNDQQRRAALWWCGATARRIMINETRPAVLSWCLMVAERCFDEFRV